MCGRYALDEFPLLELFGIRLERARYNIAPDQGGPARRSPAERAPIIRAAKDGGREVAFVQWWLLPHWSKERYIKYSTFNARIETVATAAAFRDPFKYRRCLVPATLFYEWEDTPRGKQPWAVRPAEGTHFAFAGLWDRWEDGEEIVESCTVIVQDPDPLIASVHNRMPVILAPALWDDWLDPNEHDSARMLALLHANPGVRLIRYPVNTEVSSTRNEGPQLIEPTGPPFPAGGEG